MGARVTVHGRQTWLGTFPTEDAARAAVALVQAGQRSERVSGWFAAWPAVAGARRERSPETIARTAALAGGFVAELGDVPLLALTRERCVGWAVRNPGTMRYARTVLEDAVWAGVLRENPLAGVRVDAGERRETGVLSEEMVLSAAEAAPAVMRALILVCGFSGLRMFEALALEARDLAGGTLHVRAGKGGREGWSVLFEPGLSAFASVAPDVGRVFPVWSRQRVHREWRKVAPAGTFHDLRHFHATWLIGRGVARADVAAQLRHAGLRDVDRYLHAERVAPAALDRVRRAA